MFGWPRKSRSTSGTGGTWRYWWFCVINFWNFFQYLCFQGQGIHCWYSYSYWATMFGLSWKSMSTSGTDVLESTDDWVLYISGHFFTIYVFEVKQPNFDISTEPPCSGDLKNPGQLPAQAVLMILPYGFLKFLYYLGFQGRGIHCWYFYWATSFEWPRTTGSTSGSRGFWGHPNKVAQ